MNLDFVIRVLRLFEDRDDGLMWSTEDNTLEFYVRCNDLFWWGSADAEKLTPDNVEHLEQAVTDVTAIRHGAPPTYKEHAYSLELFCARERKMRPQGAAYPADPLVWPLFDACGPERSLDMLNPQPHPAQR